MLSNHILQSILASMYLQGLDNVSSNIYIPPLPPKQNKTKKNLEKTTTRQTLSNANGDILVNRKTLAKATNVL